MLIEKIKHNKILVIGDLMLDLYLRGQASRISPEAPVPVVAAEEKISIPGGAANVVMNLRALGCSVAIAGFIGKDEEGCILRDKLNTINVNTECVLECNLPTIQKTRVIANGQHIVRFDFDSDFGKVKEQRELYDLIEALSISRTFDAIIVSDYCKGTINHTLMEILKLHFRCPIVGDTKPEHKQYFSNVWCITPNLIEAHQMLGNGNPLLMAKGLKESMQLKCIIITMADHGILCVDENDNDFSYPAHVEINEHDPKHRFDVTGAGDTVVSVFTACIAAGLPTHEAVLAANIAAGVVVRKIGTAACSFEELIVELEKEDYYERSAP
ncbi:MAG: bifunctional heptose 7-phosphate kinase/heptose 1-phosphate adenyltransferase [Promethearchaeota archaeon]|jgi:D-beta-D-heptose 7-phosphate kinase/D-beta-D-heptose 1-phosphate adenosyltransferase